MPIKQDNLIIVPPIYRDVSSIEVRDLEVIDMNAGSFCHILLVERENEPYHLSVIAEVSPDTPGVKVTEEENGEQTFAWHGRVPHRWASDLTKKGVVIPKDREGT